MTNQTCLITGNSTGLGLAFTEILLENGSRVYGFSRRGCDLKHDQLRDIRINLADADCIKPSLTSLLAGVTSLDLVVLNAGILGEIEPMQQVEMRALQKLMDINVWSNKLILDYLYESGIEVKQVVAMSSGAAVNGNKGWGAYSLSKATLNMLVKLYAAEHAQTHFVALAPGLVDTQMQDHLCDSALVDESQFPSVKKLRAARGTQAMPTPAVAAENMIRVFSRLRSDIASGEFIDMRSL